MERRKFVTGLGALATGSAAAMGTGAFSGTQATVTRTATVSVAEDDEAYIGLDEGPGAEFTTRNDGETLTIDLSKVNSNSEYVFGNELTVENNFDREVKIAVKKRLNGDRVNGDQVRLYAPWELENGKTKAENRIDLQEGENAGELTLGSGDSVNVTIAVSTGSVDSDVGDAHRESDLDITEVPPDEQLVDGLEFNVWS